MQESTDMVLPEGEGVATPKLANCSTGDGGDDQLLLEDVNRVLTNITDEEQSQRITLSRKQIASLVGLEKRIRASLSKQKKDIQSTITRKQEQITRVRRRLITGDSEKRVRDFAQEAKVVKTVDKFAFCLGVLVLCATEYMVLQHPESFGTYYCALVSVMMALRLYMYAKSGWLYFVLDFCYWANASCFVSVLILPENDRLWRLNFAVSNGTLLGALLAWRNSLVFHSLDKVTSIVIHLLPGLLTFIQRSSANGKMCPPNDDAIDCSLGIAGSILEPLLFYALWQAVYIIKTEVIDRKRFMADPSLQTSLRWLTRDKKNAMHKISKQVCRIIGVLKPDEDFDPEALKTKLVFWIGQLIFTLVTLLPTHFLFAHQELHVAYFCYTFAMTVWNGSCYYFEVFASRYIQQLEKQEAMSKASEKEN